METFFNSCLNVFPLQLILKCWKFSVICHSIMKSLLSIKRVLIWSVWSDMETFTNRFWALAFKNCRHTFSLTFSKYQNSYQSIGVINDNKKKEKFNRKWLFLNFLNVWTKFEQRFISMNRNSSTMQIQFEQFSDLIFVVWCFVVETGTKLNSLRASVIILNSWITDCGWLLFSLTQSINHLDSLISNCFLNQT